MGFPQLSRITSAHNARGTPFPPGADFVTEKSAQREWAVRGQGGGRQGGYEAPARRCHRASAWRTISTSLGKAIVRSASSTGNQAASSFSQSWSRTSPPVARIKK